MYSDFDGYKLIRLDVTRNWIVKPLISLCLGSIGKHMQADFHIMILKDANRADFNSTLKLS